MASIEEISIAPSSEIIAIIWQAAEYASFSEAVRDALRD